MTGDEDDETSWAWEIVSWAVWIVVAAVIVWAVWLLLHPGQYVS